MKRKKSRLKKIIKLAKKPLTKALSDESINLLNTKIMYELQDLTNDQLVYLKSKWSSEITETEKQIVKDQRRLDKRLTRQEEDQSAIEAALQDLTNQQTILQAMIDSNVDATAIALQEAAVAVAQEYYDSEVLGESNVSAEEVQLILIQLEILQSSNVLRASKIAEIETLISTSG